MYVRYPIVAMTLILSCFILRTNNLAWAEAGKLTNNLLNEFARIHNDPNNIEKRLYFLNIPENYKGVAINGLNCMESMNHVPFAQKNYINTTWLLHADQALPIGLLKYDIAWGNVFAYFYYFDIKSNHFQLIDFPKYVVSNCNEDVGRAVKIKLKKRSQQLQIISSLMASRLISNAHSRYLFYPSKLGCWDVDAIVLKINIENIEKIKNNHQVQLIYTNNILKIADNAERVTTELDPTKREQCVVFMLRGRPAWTFGGTCNSIEVIFPSNCDAKISDAYAACINDQMPTIKVFFPGYDKNTGRFKFSNEYPKVTMRYDTNNIKGCAGVVVEAIGPCENFKELNSQDSMQISLIDLRSMAPCGQIAIPKSKFKDNGLYKVRLRPIDKFGEQIGFCSDYFLLYISNKDMSS